MTHHEVIQHCVFGDGELLILGGQMPDPLLQCPLLRGRGVELLPQLLHLRGQRSAAAAAARMRSD